MTDQTHVSLELKPRLHGALERMICQHFQIEPTPEGIDDFLAPRIAGWKGRNTDDEQLAGVLRVLRAIEKEGRARSSLWSAESEITNAMFALGKS